MEPLYLFIIFALICFSSYQYYFIRQIKKKNLESFRKSLKEGHTVGLQDWDDGLDKFTFTEVTIIQIQKYSIKVIDQSMKYRICNIEDLFPLNYHKDMH